MLQLIRSLRVLLFVSPLFLVPEAQFFDTGSASLGRAPVGFISRVGVFGDRENIASLGNSPVGVYQRRQYPPQAWYQAPIVEVHRPARPQVRPAVRPGCSLPGPCHDRVVRPARPPPARPAKPQVRPPPKPAVRPPVKPPCRSCGGQKGKPVRPPPTRPDPKPVVRPPKIPTPFVTRIPKTNKAHSKPGAIEGRNSGGLLGSLLGPLLG
ncbi:uncharacterized protein LOC129972773 [Argiope bruennichi]|uniref:Uncharacterized protein n=1 Tax=Argiope bruennichi TaxID=94029 RepID=A0A8T0F7H6_ARGBR|nr:uncharacterized protein LOC129972773 [Argiope bruennichi]KAF8787154.1 hypothetical protein HNY73_008779 [Argiope bruennichi]